MRVLSEQWRESVETSGKRVRTDADVDIDIGGVCILDQKEIDMSEFWDWDNETEELVNRVYGDEDVADIHAGKVTEIENMDYFGLYEKVKRSAAKGHKIFKGRWVLAKKGDHFWRCRWGLQGL